jgi:hypothetical protein
MTFYLKANAKVSFELVKNRFSLVNGRLTDFTN